jgi:hypothetical protein
MTGVLFTMLASEIEATPPAAPPIRIDTPSVHHSVEAADAPVSRLPDPGTPTEEIRVYG